jgi:hypothetical protein
VKQMTTRFPRLRQLIDDWRKPPDVVPLKPTWEERARAGINWVMVSTIVGILRLVLWMLDKPKKGV